MTLAQISTILRQYSTVLKSNNPEFMNEFLILKATPKAVISMQNRLNKKLVTISDKLIDELIRDYGYNANVLRPDVVAAFSDSVPGVYQLGVNTILEIVPHTQFEANLLTESQLSELFDTRIFNASETTMQRLTGDIMPKIKEAIRDGQAYNTTAAELKPQFKDMADWQMRRIARTEVHSSYNESKLEAMRRVDSVEGKEWVSSGRRNMRPAHGYADGQIVPVDEPFIVMGEELQYPGDPSGSSKNVIQCACTMKPIIRKINE